MAKIVILSALAFGIALSTMVEMSTFPSSRLPILRRWQLLTLIGGCALLPLGPDKKRRAWKMR